MGFWENHKQLKKKTVAEVKKDKEALKSRKQTIKQLSDKDAQKAKEELKAERKEQKISAKQAIKDLPKAEQKQAKKQQKMYRKIWNRPRRFTIWGIIAGAVLLAGIQVGPTVTSMYNVMSGKTSTVDTSGAEALAARQAGEAIGEQIANEGLVLIKNEDNQLPLTDKKVNVFGTSAFNFRFGGGGSGGADTSRAISFFDGLANAGIDYNQELYELYAAMPETEQEEGGTGLVQVVMGFLNPSGVDEPTIDYLTEDIVTQAKEYSENAVIVINSNAVEASDVGEDQLTLSENKAALVKEVATNFENVTVIVNAGNTLELGFIEDYPSIKSVLWVGTPGPTGTNAIGAVLAGELNPSGRLTDTYAYDANSSPASVNFGDYQYENLDKAFMTYQEGIYVGYRFYETYYQDEAQYQEVVQFPFGYGLSYTDFAWEIVDQTMNEDTIEMKVEVTNTGEVAGKDVVQLYYGTPYTPGGIEKSATNLGIFTKTKELQPNEKQVVTLQMSSRDMASYDMANEYYVLEKGTYQIRLGKNAHETVETIPFELEGEIVYTTDEITGTEYQNRFNQSGHEETYLSRDDWEGTYPDDQKVSTVATEKEIELVNGVEYIEPDEEVLIEQENGLKLSDLRNVAYEDPQWQQFVEQFSIEEMMDFVTEGAYQTNAIERLGVEHTNLADGPAGINSFFGAVEAAAYPSEIVVAATWNTELAYQMGEAVGQEARAYNVQGWYAPAFNIHRTPMGGRNFEYFSEDPVLNGYMGANMSQGAEDQGIVVFMKHFAMNDQETNARSGVLIWSNEQAMREIHLKPFEIAVKEADLTGVMSSFSYLDGQWANSELLNGVLRDEWGFRGIVSSDAVFGFMTSPKAITSGNDLMLDIMSVPKNQKLLEKAYQEHPEAVTKSLQTSMHNILYAWVQTYQYE